MTQQAELKVPDGKLLRADVRASDTIEAVELHGDFFVYPEEALDDVENAMQGVRSDSGVDELERRVAQALDDDTELVGFTPAHVAQVVRKAIEEGDTDED